MTVTTIDLGLVFSKYLGARSRSSGPFSAEEFYEKQLQPALRVHDTVVIELDSLCGYTATFFDEVIQRLLTDYSVEDVGRKVRWVAVTRPYLINAIALWTAEHAAAMLRDA